SAIEEGLRYQVHHRLPDLYLIQGYVLGNIATRAEAIESYREAMRWAEELNEVRIQIIARNNIASELIRDEAFAAAETLLLEARTIAQDQERNRELQFVEFNLADIEVKRGNYEAGIARMLAIREEITRSGSGRDEAELLYYLALAYREAGQFEQQATTLLELHEVRQRIFRSDREQLMAEMQARYEAHDQAQQITLLRQENQLHEQQLQNTRLLRGISVLAVLVMALVLIVIAMGYRASRKTNQQLNEANRRLHQQALLDPLTGLGNRRHFQNLMQKRSQLEQAPPSVLMLLDLDHFKQINDTLGHAAGDEVLREIALRLKRVSGEHAEVIRWGGEEFLIYAPCENSAVAAELTEDVLLALNSEPVRFNGEAIAVQGTIGTVLLPLYGVDEAQLDWEKAIQLADNLLYVGKLQGRNQAHCLNRIYGAYTHIEQLLFRDFNAVLEQGALDVTKIQLEVSER
ncbi:MAG: GGDEF domain-containing protein, partial [Gammaproteobacteria bacterium]|nr:GGDEF domain-containing protein [Gammaproteobacteria bacterium]